MNVDPARLPVGNAAAVPSASSWSAELGLDPRSLRRIVVGLVLLLVVSAGLGYLVRAPLTEAAQWFVDELGMLGLFFGVLLVDSWVLPPLTHEPLLFFAYAGGVSYLDVWACAGLASTLAGPVGYLFGRLFGRRGPVARRLQGSGLEALMHRRGAWVVAAGALTPIPFSVTTWLAGAAGMPVLPFLAASMVRFLKVAIYLGLIALGWAVT